MRLVLDPPSPPLLACSAMERQREGLAMKWVWQWRSLVFAQTRLGIGAALGHRVRAIPRNEA